MKKLDNKLGSKKESIFPDPNDKKELNNFIKGMIKLSQHAEKKILEDMPWINYLAPKRRLKNYNTYR